METDYKSLPNLPGVYLFKDINDQVIYVGKAKSLKARVRSYFHNKEDWKVQVLVKEAHRVEHVLTNTEAEALLLEAELVQEYDPKFNVLLKTGQPFVYLVITNEKLPKLEIVRNKNKKGKYFGPFIQKQQARAVHNFLIKTFQLFCCKKKIPNGCLDYHLKLCAGTCREDFNKVDYIFRTTLIQDVLQKNHRSFLKKLDQQIKEHVRNLEFEKAAHLHQYREGIYTIFKTLDAKYSHKKYASAVTVATLPVQEIDDYEKTAAELKTILGLKGLPETIDCFDISHFQSRYIVGSCIRFKNGKPDKNKFRRFKIKTLTQQNDCAALQEIVMRRYKNSEELPDLVLIDGGKGQRNAVLPLLKETCCVSLAKREELLFTNFHPDGLPLKVTTNIGKLLISLRDYAHHFAISYHKLIRRKQ